ncbi:hypothetical protein N9B39_00150 [bacterium]|nr:hypothetical protein [bacterium]
MKKYADYQPWKNQSDAMMKQLFPAVDGRRLPEDVFPFARLVERCFHLGLRVGVACCVGWMGSVVHAQDEGVADPSVVMNADGIRTILLESRTPPPPPPVFFSAQVVAHATIGSEFVDQTVELTIKVVQGEPEILSFGLNGPGQVLGVAGEGIASWSVRQTGKERFLDLQLNEGVSDPKPVIKMRSPQYRLPAVVTFTHLGPGDSVGFDSKVSFAYGAGVTGNLTTVNGFVPLSGRENGGSFQTSSGGKIELSLARDSASPEPIELVNTTLSGAVSDDGQSALFQLETTARVTDPSVEMTVLSGNAALVQMPNDANYQVRLAKTGKQTVYKVGFSKAGTFAVKLEFVAKVVKAADNQKSLDFTIAAGAVVPVRLQGLGAGLTFHRDQQSVVPLWQENVWVGFLPATGRVHVRWKPKRTAGEGKLFFTTTGNIEARVGSGLLRQDHVLEYQVLQGELGSLSMILRGPGEILDVNGDNIVAWQVSENDGERLLDVTLSQPITDTAQVSIRSQTPLGAFPVRMEGLRLEPVGTIRHSGFLRLANLGSVRLEPTGLSGLTQLSPDQFPGKAIQARQVYVYRFPAASHAFTVAADRIQPEVSVSELLLYQLAETDRVIRADIELDIREAPIREWNFSVPSDYSVVSVTGASVADYLTASEVVDGLRNLKTIFANDVSGRQLISLHLEKSEPAAAGDWKLPRIEHTEAKAVRGDIGIIGAPGFRLAVGATDLLVEKPLSYFPKPTANLQQAFRIREPDWSATMKIELLDRSIQSDVFHLYSLSQETIYGSALINYFITGAPISELRITFPESLKNEVVDGQNVQDSRRDGDTLIVSLHQPVMGPYTLLVTFEEKPSDDDGTFSPGQVAPLGVQGERGYIQIVSPMQVESETVSISDGMLVLDPLELPAEFRLLSTAPPLGTWQYTARPFNLQLDVKWFQPGTTVSQVIEFSEAESHVSRDGELVTEVLYYVKSRGERSLRIKIPGAPVRLWEVSVDGSPVTARRSGDETLIPLPGGIDPSIPVEVRLRLGKPAVNESRPELMLPVLFAPVLKTEWSIQGDDQRVLVPAGGTVEPPVPVLRPSGFDWLARRGTGSLLLIIVLTVVGVVIRSSGGEWRHIGLLPLAAALYFTCIAASSTQTGDVAPLLLSLPILSAGDVVRLDVNNIPTWQVNISMFGILIFLVSVAGFISSQMKSFADYRMPLRIGSVFLVFAAVLMQRDSASWFFWLLASVIFMFFFAGAVWDGLRTAQGQRARTRAEKQTQQSADFHVDDKESEGGSAPVTAVVVMLGLLLSSLCSPSVADDPQPQQASAQTKQLADPQITLQAADSIQQTWLVTHVDERLTAKGKMTLTGNPGDRFLLLKSPAVLTRFEGEGLRLTKSNLPGSGLVYVVSIPAIEDGKNKAESDQVGSEKLSTDQTYQVEFDFQVEAVNPGKGIAVPTGDAAVQKLELTYDEAGWDVHCSTAVKIEPITEKGQDLTRSRLLLGPEQAIVMLKPKARDVTMEQTKFFVETSNLFLPGPGVVDGRHQINVRASQGQVSELTVFVPSGLTVSDVGGPVESWQFDADEGRLTLEVSPVQSQSFNINVETQRGLEPLPADVNLAPLRVEEANGEVGLVAIAFGPDAQPETLQPEQMSTVNVGDFDFSLNTNPEAILHRVYRYGADGGKVELRVSPVASEVRVISNQVLSLGDERVVLAVNFSAEISRAGLFQLSFPLPAGLEVESLSGPSLHHWAELSEDGQRQIILHLNGKTIGPQSFALTLTGNTPTNVAEWEIPHFELNEGVRQTGEIVVRPTTGIRLRTLSRQNVSETDPRAIGGKSPGALAFRLLQRDWKLVLGIEKLEPRISGNILQEIILREGQTRSAIIASFNVQNASIRAMEIVLPISDPNEIPTASGKTVSDLVQIDPDKNLWEVQFKRRVLGKVDFRIEYERRGDRSEEAEMLRLAEFPQAGQLPFYFAVRAGGRLEIKIDEMPQGWQKIDWNVVPASLRDSENRNAPVVTLKAQKSAVPLAVEVERHSLADSLKLRVASGELLTVLSPKGDQLTSVDVSMEVIQRSSLSVGLPKGGEIFSIFVNGESVNSIRVGGETNAWQFYILPGMDDRTANVRFVYTVPGSDLGNLRLESPQLNVPLENIQWSVIAPKGFELTGNDGNLELVGRTNQAEYDRQSYLSKTTRTRQRKAEQAAITLQQANQFIQKGEQTKANWALNSVANQYGLDAASNEDARIQLENLQTQQAIVGLNTRRQRLFLDNDREETALGDNQQMRQAAAENPILQQDQLNFQPQELSQLLRGNSTEDIATLQRIAGRLVQHQRTSEPAPQAIVISLPEEGQVYTFSRSVQVAENAPLELELDFESSLRLPFLKSTFALGLLVCFAAMIGWSYGRNRETM